MFFHVQSLSLLIRGFRAQGLSKAPRAAVQSVAIYCAVQVCEGPPLEIPHCRDLQVG